MLNVRATRCFLVEYIGDEVARVLSPTEHAFPPFLITLQWAYTVVVVPVAK